MAEQLDLNDRSVRTSPHRTRRKMRKHLAIAIEPKSILTEETP